MHESRARAERIVDALEDGIARINNIRSGRMDQQLDGWRPPSQRDGDSEASSGAVGALHESRVLLGAARAARMRADEAIAAAAATHHGSGPRADRDIASGTDIDMALALLRDMEADLAGLAASAGAPRRTPPRTGAGARGAEAEEWPLDLGVRSAVSRASAFPLGGRERERHGQAAAAPRLSESSLLRAGEGGWLGGGRGSREGAWTADAPWRGDEEAGSSYAPEPSTPPAAHWPDPLVYLHAPELPRQGALPRQRPESRPAASRALRQGDRDGVGARPAERGRGARLLEAHRWGDSDRYPSPRGGDISRGLSPTELVAGSNVGSDGDDEARRDSRPTPGAGRGGSGGEDATPPLRPSDLEPDSCGPVRQAAGKSAAGLRRERPCAGGMSAFVGCEELTPAELRELRWLLRVSSGT